MKTENVRMTEIALEPYLTLVLFSAPPDARTTGAVPRSFINVAPDWIAALPPTQPGITQSGAPFLPNKSDRCWHTNNRPRAK